MQRRIITPGEAAKMKTMRSQGMLLRQIADITGFSMSTICNAIRRINTPEQKSQTVVKRKALKPGKVIGFLEWVDQKAVARGFTTTEVVESALGYLASGGEIPIGPED